MPEICRFYGIFILMNFQTISLRIFMHGMEIIK